MEDTVVGSDESCTNPPSSPSSFEVASSGAEPCNSAQDLTAADFRASVRESALEAIGITRERYAALVGRGLSMWNYDVEEPTRSEDDEDDFALNEEREGERGERETLARTSEAERSERETSLSERPSIRWLFR